FPRSLVDSPAVLGRSGLVPGQLLLRLFRAARIAAEGTPRSTVRLAPRQPARLVGAVEALPAGAGAGGGVLPAGAGAVLDQLHLCALHRFSLWLGTADGRLHAGAGRRADRRGAGAAGATPDAETGRTSHDPGRPRVRRRRLLRVRVRAGSLALPVRHPVPVPRRLAGPPAQSLITHQVDPA